MEVCGQLHTQAILPPGERNSRIHWIQSWVGPRASPDAMEYRNISCPCWESNASHPVHSASLFRLSYPTSVECLVKIRWENLTIPSLAMTSMDDTINDPLPHIRALGKVIFHWICLLWTYKILETAWYYKHNNNGLEQSSQNFWDHRHLRGFLWQTTQALQHFKSF
jgi:hypothetical protein